MILRAKKAKAERMAEGKSNIKIVADNRKARHDYFIEDTVEAGLVLTGTEIKSVREGRVQLKDSYVSIRHGEALIKGMHISPYKYGNIFNVDPDRDRKLLLHRREIRKLFDKVRLKGYTLVPLKIYLKDGMAKMEIALARGKNLYDKRETQKLRDAKRAMEKALKLTR